MADTHPLPLQGPPDLPTSSSAPEQNAPRAAGPPTPPPLPGGPFPIAPAPQPSAATGGTSSRRWADPTPTPLGAPEQQSRRPTSSQPPPEKQSRPIKGAASNSERVKHTSKSESASAEGAAGQRTAVDSAAPEESIEEIAYRVAPAWLISTVGHLVILIAMGLYWVAPKFMPASVPIEAVYANQYGVQMKDPSVLSGDKNDDTDRNIITSDAAIAVDDPFATPAVVDITLDGSSASAMLRSPTIGNALNGREEGMRRTLLGRYGGNTLTEGSVKSGLDWLSKQQKANGSWSMTGPYSDGARVENDQAATAMALLAFQGQGHTHRGKGPYQKNVDAGIKYLMKVQDADGNFYDGNNHNAWFYTQGQCTIVICELYGMTKDTQLRDAAERAVKFCIGGQDALGGWRYRPRQDSDTSVTGWIVMALQSARMAGLEVPSETLERVSGYLDKVASNDGSRYSYQPGQAPDEVMTAEALLCRQYLGWHRSDERLVAGVDYLLSHLPNWPDRNVYYWYYGTQVMHHMGGKPWEQWNKVLSKLLVENQEQKGPEKGSWDPNGEHPDFWGSKPTGGRLYVTCLSIFMLESYYRHMPIYSGNNKL